MSKPLLAGSLFSLVLIAFGCSAVNQTSDAGTHPDTLDAHNNPDLIETSDGGDAGTAHQLDATQDSDLEASNTPLDSGPSVTEATCNVAVCSLSEGLACTGEFECDEVCASDSAYCEGRCTDGVFRLDCQTPNSSDASIERDAGLDAAGPFDSGIVSSGTWRETHSYQPPARPYFNCLSGDGRIAAYFLDGGGMEVRHRSAEGWDRIWAYRALPLLGGSTAFYRCSLSQDGSRILVGNQLAALIAERRVEGYAVLAQLNPYGVDRYGRTDGDARVFLSADGRSALVGGQRAGEIYTDATGTWQSWQRTILPSPLGHATGSFGNGIQLSATPELNRFLVSEHQQSWLFENNGGTWTTRSVPACLAADCAIHPNRMEAASCQIGGTSVTCQVRTVETGTVLRSATVEVTSLGHGTVSFYDDSPQKHVQWSGNDVLVAWVEETPIINNVGQVVGYSVYQWLDNSFIEIDGGGSIWGDFSASADGHSLILTNVGAQYLTSFER